MNIEKYREWTASKENNWREEFFLCHTWKKYITNLKVVIHSFIYGTCTSNTNLNISTKTTTFYRFKSTCVSENGKLIYLYI